MKIIDGRVKQGSPFGLVRRVLWVLVALTLGAYVWVQSAAPASEALLQPGELYGDAPSFSLVDQRGNAFSSDELQGKVWLANFIFTRCEDECPRVSGVLANVAGILEKDGLLGEQVRIVSITVDPHYDTPERLAEYADRFGADPEWWHFLTGDHEYIQRLLTEGFHVTMINQANVPLFGNVALAHGPEGTNIIHSERIVVVDQEGVIQAYVEGLQTPPGEIAEKVRALVREGGST